MTERNPDPRKTEPFTKVPNALLKRKDLSLATKIVAAILMAHGRQYSPIFPSMKVVASEADLSERGVRKAISTLVEKGEFKAARDSKRGNNRYYPSKSLASLFGYAGQTTESLADNERHRVPLTEEQSAAVSGTECRSINKSNSQVVESNSTGAPETRLSQLNAKANVLVMEADGVERTGTECRSERQIGYSRFEHTHDALLASILRKWSVGSKVAADLAAEFPAWRIRQQLCWLPFRAARDPAAFLVRAIQREFEPPSRLTTEEMQIVKDAIDTGKVPLPIGAPEIPAFAEPTVSPGDYEMESESDMVPF